MLFHVQRHLLIIVLDFQFLTNIEITEVAVVGDVYDAESPIDRRHHQRVKQVPLRFAEIIGITVENDTVRNEIKRIVAAAYTLVAQFQQILMLIDHAEAEHTVDSNDKLG